MASNPYATPESDVRSHLNTEVHSTSIWGKKGRFSVLSYLGRSLLLSIVSTLLIGIAIVAVALLTGNGASPEEMFNPENFNPLAFIPVAIVILASFWIGACQAIKRFHDLNLNGWWLLTVFILIGIIILFIPSKGHPNRFGGWRPTRLWEKIMAILYLMFLALSFAGPFIGLGAMGGLGGLGALGS